MSDSLFTPPEIDYLSKDFVSFQRLMRDHLATLLPDWEEQNPSDMGNALIELLAYVGDYLSYYQDAVATEAYLGTARRRMSVDRHLRLLDYYLHEGCNARALVQIAVNNEVTLPKKTQLITRSAAPLVIEDGSSTYLRIKAENAHFFETMHETTLIKAHNEIYFYVPEGASEILEKGATSALLQNGNSTETATKLQLKVGDILIFKQVRHPTSGEEGLADTTQRHAVRLTNVAETTFTNQEKQTDHVLRIGWDAVDALPFAMVLKRYGDEETSHVTMAYGNIVLADYGRTTYKLLPAVASKRYAPRLTSRVLTYYEPMLPNLPIAQALKQNPRYGEPAVQLWQVGPQFLGSASGIRFPVRGKANEMWLIDNYDQAQFFFERQGKVHWTTPWSVQRELLNSSSMARDYRVELVDSRDAQLRFGFGDLGWQPQVGDEFVAAYRVGSGEVGNVGLDSIRHIVSPKGLSLADSIAHVTNLLPAVGGRSRERIETARLLAPATVQTQARCVTLPDYENVANRHPEVEEARAERQWIGTKQTVAVHVRRLYGKAIDRRFQHELEQFMLPFRIIGTDIQIREPEVIPVYLEINFTPFPHASRHAVYNALLRTFDSTQVDGFFHPSHFSMGQALYRSQIMGAASVVSGVQTVYLNHFSTKSGDEQFVEEIISVPETAVIYLGKLTITYE